MAPVFVTWRLSGSPRAVDPIVAAVVRGTIELGQRVLDLYEVHAWIVMANHVHLLLTPKTSLARITDGLKGVMAKQAREVLGLAEQPFWQAGSFDQPVRDAREFNRIRHYIEYNPVSAGLVERPEDWPWSSASARGGRT